MNSNRGSLVSESTALPFVPQPEPLAERYFPAGFRSYNKFTALILATLV